MRILVLKTWLQNIGNGFIDKGAVTVVREAFPDAEIIEVSGFPNYTDNVEPTEIRTDTTLVSWLRQSKLARTASTLISYSRSDNSDQTIDDEYFEGQRGGNMVNVAEFIDADIAVFPGCVLYRHALDKYIQTLQHLNDTSTPIVLLGAGGGNYEPQTVETVRKILDQIQPAALLTRDERAYEKYNDMFELSYNGIDCGLFIDEWYGPPDANQEILAATFDKTNEPELDTDARVIRPNHGPFPTYGTNPKAEYFKKNDTLLSDSLVDYLMVYANAEETHSDRIHACIPALAYGNRAQFYYDTPRSLLFDRVLTQDITKEPIKIDRNRLKREKSNQISEFRAIVERCIDKDAIV